MTCVFVTKSRRVAHPQGTSNSSLDALAVHTLHRRHDRRHAEAIALTQTRAGRLVRVAILRGVVLSGHTGEQSAVVVAAHLRCIVVEPLHVDGLIGHIEVDIQSAGVEISAATSNGGPAGVGEHGDGEATAHLTLKSGVDRPHVEGGGVVAYGCG